MIQDLFNNKIVNIYKQLRFSNLYTTHVENVAEHSCILANIAILISIEMNKYLNKKIDIKDVAYRSIIHDYGEAVTCDVTYDVKYSTPEFPEFLDKLERLGLSKLGLPDEFIEDIQTAKNKDTVEGCIVELGDRIEALFKLLREYMIQRTVVYKDSIYQNSIPSVRKALNNLKVYMDNNNCIKIIDELNGDLDKIITILDGKVDFL